MNIENMKTLIDQLKRLPDEKFYMSTWAVHPEEFEYFNIPRNPSCGTVACIAGWTSLLNGGPTKITDGDSFAQWAEDWLGLTHKQAYSLFMGEWTDDPDDMRDVTRTDAIAELERLLSENTRSTQPSETAQTNAQTD